MSLIKKIFRVASANGIQVLSGIVLGFLLPKFLTIEGYAEYKTFTLYASYIGLLHLGFPDGLYIDYGGKAYQQLDHKQLKSEFVFFIVFEIIFTIIVAVPSVVMQNWIGIMLALAILPYNMNTYFKRLYQSTDMLGRYSNCILIYSIIDTCACLVLIFLIDVENPYLYCLIPIIANAAICIIEGIKFRKMVSGEKIEFDLFRYASLIKSGFIILIGNLAVNLFYGIDRWMVKLFFSVEEFSYYSFAVSMLNIATTILQAISISLFANFANGKLNNKLTVTKDFLLAIGSVSSTVYFFLSFVVQNFLPTYIDSLSIIATTMAIFPYLIYINAITINLYKANHQEKHYVKMITCMLVLAAVLDLIVVNFRKTELVALMTLLCYVVWYWISRIEARENCPVSAKEVVYLVVCTLSFLACSRMSAVTGLILYVLICGISSMLYLKRYLKILISRK